MTDTEREAIEYLEEHKKYFDKQIEFINTLDTCEYDEELELYKNKTKQFEIALHLIKKQQAEIEKKDKIIDLMANCIYRMDWRSEYGNTRIEIKYSFINKVEEENGQKF